MKITKIIQIQINKWTTDVDSDVGSKDAFNSEKSFYQLIKSIFRKYLTASDFDNAAISYKINDIDPTKLIPSPSLSQSSNYPFKENESLWNNNSLFYLNFLILPIVIILTYSVYKRKFSDKTNQILKSIVIYTLFHLIYIK
jgi:hypothetical protein